MHFLTASVSVPSRFRRVPAMAATACLLVCGGFEATTPAAIAQEDLDRPAQRWLPMPLGEVSDVTQQAELLQQLCELVSAQDPSDILPLHQAQWEAMRRQYDQWRQQSADADKLPELGSLPQEWLDEALDDPGIRRQAQMFLEQYARDRHLPTLGANGRNSLGIPFPGMENSAEISDPLTAAESSPQSTNARPRAGNSDSMVPPGRTAGSPPTADENRQEREKKSEPIGSAIEEAFETELDSSVPTRTGESLSGPEINADRDEDSSVSRAVSDRQRPDADQLRALKDLFEQLADISKQNDPAEEWKSSRSVFNAPGVTERSAASNSLRTRPGMLPDPTNRSSADVSTEGRSSNASQPPNALDPGDTSSAATQQSTNSLREIFSGRSSQNLSSSGTKLPGDRSQRPADNAATDSPVNSLERLRERNGRRTGNSVLPARDASHKGAGTPADVRSAAQAQDDVLADSNAADASEGLDIQQTIERFGIGGALKKIVRKALEEQGENSQQVFQAINNLARGTTSAANRRILSDSAATRSFQAPADATLGPASSRQPAPAEIQSSEVARSVAGETPNVGGLSRKTTPGGNRNSVAPPGGLEGLAADVWKAISSTPRDTESNASANPSSSARPTASDSVGSGIRWSFRARQLWILLGTLLIAAVFWFLARWSREEVETAELRQSAARVNMLAAGIKTRNDIVAAFHLLALQRPYSASTWWTHRTVARQIAEQTPQIRDAIEELAVIYEQARYLPADARLSAEQIVRARSVIEQCVAPEAAS